MISIKVQTYPLPYSLACHILEGPKSPDIIFLQETTPDVLAALLVTDVKDKMSFEGVPLRPRCCRPACALPRARSCRRNATELREGESSYLRLRYRWDAILRRCAIQSKRGSLSKRSSCNLLTLYYHDHRLMKHKRHDNSLINVLSF